MGSYGSRALLVAEITQQQRGFSQRLSPQHPFIEAEVVYAVRSEYALRIEDVLARRMRLAFLDTGAAKGAVERVGAIMGELLGWSEEQMRGEVSAARGFLDTMHVSGTPSPQKAAEPNPER